MLPIPVHTQYGIWLRAPSSSGGKDWIGFLTDRAVISHWGKTGAVIQSRTLFNQPSSADLQRKIDAKRDKGYFVIGVYRADTGWSHLQPSLPAAPSPPSQPVSKTRLMQSWLETADDNPWF
jgi:hypothetical protein